MKIQELLIEGKSIYSQRMKQVERDAKRFRKQVDSSIEKRRKEEERNQKNQERLNKRDTKKSISTLISDSKKKSKDKESLDSLIFDYKDKIKPETYELVKYMSRQIDRLKTKKQNGTRLITRNFLIIPKVLEHPLVKDSLNPKILNAVSKIIRISNIELNPKFKRHDKIGNFRIINNVLFNAIRDLAFELMRQDMINLQGVNDGN